MDKSGKILIVDDETMVTRTLSMLLGLEGFSSVVLFNNPNEALEYLNGNEVDLIISDFIMPEMNGIEFLENAKKRKKMLRQFCSQVMPIKKMPLEQLMK